MEKKSLNEVFDSFDAQWQPHLIGTVNETAVKVAKIEGEFVWHHHETEDEMFIVIKGSFDMELRDRTITLEEGDYLVVPRGVEHRPVARQECWIMMVEPATTLNTGNVQNERTREPIEV
ncbi:MAG: cupin domain-containing protein [Alphaproteobacteria bacterium]|nr:cupin domain-containing protein [Alphaproteobacteria bacterium]